MKVLISGACGFVGRRLVRELLDRGELVGEPLRELALVDRSSLPSNDGRVRWLTGDIGDREFVASLGEFQPDFTFHLASLPGGAAERDYAAGRRINLDATLALFEALALPREQPRRPPRVVLASTVAVYGADLPPQVTPTTPLRPAITYGAHKLVTEILLADFSRKGLLDGRSIRLPGIVARPRGPSGLASAFMSDMMHALAAGEPFTCPVSPSATAWWMSLPCCVENLLHAAEMRVDGADSARAWQLPVLRLSMAQVVDTLADIYGGDRRGLVRYEPQEELEAVFGRYPELDDSEARELGLKDDGTARALVERALDITKSIHGANPDISR